MPVADTSLWGFWPRNRVRISWLLLVVTIAWVFFSEIRPASVSSALGIYGFSLVALGVLLRAWSAGVVHKDQKLATVGPYALARHPLYLGSLMAVLGIALVLGGWVLMLVYGAVFLLIYVPTLRNEERVLAAEFSSEWPGFVASTGMFWPQRNLIKRLSGASWSAAQWKFNREYQTPLMAAAALALLFIWAA